MTENGKTHLKQTKDIISNWKNTPYILYAKEEAVLEKLDRIFQDGRDKLHVIADFDMTLTNYWNKKLKSRNMSAHGMFNHYSKARSDFVQKAQQVFDTYYPVEVDPKLTMEEKIPFMVEWWTQEHDLIVNSGMGRQDIQNMVKEIDVELRNGAKEWLYWLEREKIPILVFSAGIADVIEEILKQNQLYGPQTHVISNRMIFSSVEKNEKIIGFKEPIIHVFNKNEFSGVIQSSDTCHSAKSRDDPNSDKFHQNLIQERDNVILIGDSLGDIQMGTGVEHKVMLKIGLMNRYVPVVDTTDPTRISSWVAIGTGEKVEEATVKATLQKYLDAFDVVVAGDQSFDPWLLDLMKLMQNDNIN